MAIFHRLAACVCASLALSSCQTVDKYMPTLHSYGIYKLDINQGNYITQDMVEKLKIGQTTTQVRTILGTPLLADPFHVDRWDYIYRYTRQDKLIERREFRVFFTDQKLARWEGDELPQSATELNRIAAERSLGQPPASDERSLWQRFLDMFKRDGT
jgi:outer membrane protein assembly factor BamE